MTHSWIFNVGALYMGRSWAKSKKTANNTRSVGCLVAHNPDAVIDSIIGVTVPNLTGGYSAMMPNHHITKPVLIGEIQDDGQFFVVDQTDYLVPGDAWSDYLPGSRDLISDWRAPIACGNYDESAQRCRGAGD